MPGDLFRWRQELLRLSTCMYIPGPCGHHAQQETRAGKGRRTHGQLEPSGHCPGRCQVSRAGGPAGLLARPAQAGEPVGLR